MRKVDVSTRIAGVFFVLAIAVVLVSTSSAQQPAAAVKPAGQAYKNIQILTDLPSDQLIPTMRFFSYSLGVDCEFCHVAGDDSKDDKQEKKVARDMMNMEVALNKSSFNSRTVVTCYTCHRTAAQPAPVAMIESTRIGNPAAATPTPAPKPGDPEPAAPTYPTSDAIVAKYIQALGGEAALRKITNRTFTGTRDTAGRNTQVDVAWVHGTFEDYEKAPNMKAMMMHTPTGQTTAAGFDGASSWAQAANGVVAEAAGVPLARAKRAADFYEPLDLKTEYTRLNVRGIDKVGDRDAYVVIGTVDGDNPERLYFDTQTGLLLRRTVLTNNVVIGAPTETDYLDYRDAGGVKYPSTIKIYDIPGNPLYTVLHVEKADFSAPVDSSKLVKPVSKPPAPRPATP